MKGAHQSRSSIARLSVRVCLNDLLGVLFAENQQQTGGRIHYVLFNPWAVRSNEALNSFDSPLMKLLARAIYAIVGVSVEEAIAPITHLIDNPPPHRAVSVHQDQTRRSHYEHLRQGQGGPVGRYHQKLLNR